MKKCPRCKKRKPESDFRQDSRRRDGLALNCLACNGARAKYLHHDPDSFHVAVREARKALGLTQRQLAAKLGVGLNTLQRIECGLGANTSHFIAATICVALAIEPERMLKP